MNLKNFNRCMYLYTCRYLYQQVTVPNLTNSNRMTLLESYGMDGFKLYKMTCTGAVVNLTKSSAVQHLVHCTTSQSLHTRTPVCPHSNKIQHHHPGPLIPSPTKFNNTFIRYGTKPAKALQNLLLESARFGVIRVNTCLNELRNT